ncbi:MAG: M20/M25/M40 family metallo-hydrolase [Planctomycetes bacterium]|nr:M20/M25/M40 family metallo-hydrolase [Planctomycetota bacterium]
MRLHRSSLAFGLVLLPLITGAALAPQSTDAEKIVALGKQESRVMEHLDHLANRIGPRLTGSGGLANACDWARAEFEKLGLANARLEQWGEVPVGFDRGPATGRMLAPTEKELHFATNAWTAGTKGLVTGHVVLAPTNEQELELVRSKLKGAWVLAPSAAAPERRAPANPSPPATPPVVAGAPRAAAPGATSGATPTSGETGGARGGDPASASDPARGEACATRGGDRGAQRPNRDGSAERAFREKLDKAYDEAGIAGVIRSGRGELLLTSGSSKVDFDKLPTRPSITLLAAEHADIAARVKAGESVTLAFDIRNWFVKGPITLNNVIAELPGTEKPDEIVVVGGHIDSWDGATGATDNGTGCATTIEAARLLVKAGVKPRRTIRFMLWSGEEQGLLGSAAYVKAHKDEMAKISAVLVHDGGTNYCAGITATPPMVKPLESVFAPVANLDPEMPFKVREVKGLSGGGSDHSSFLAAGVPGFFWSQRGRANYNHTHHTQFDTYDQAIPEYQVNSSIVIAVGALGIANLPELLSRENLRAPGGGGFGGRRLGVQLADDMSIEEVVEDGLAAKIGLLVGDKIVKIGDAPVLDTDEMRAALRGGPAKTKIVVLRKAKELEFAIEFPADAGGGPGATLARRLGVRFGDGLVIDVVTPGSAGDQAGLVAGDVLAKIADAAVASPQDAAAALEGASGSAKLTVLRDGKEVIVTLPLP